MKNLQLAELIVSKNFVAYIQSKEMEENMNNLILNLELIDTRTDDDVYISTILNELDQ